MNDIFTFQRFYLSIRRLMVEKGIKMMGSILVILLVVTLLLNMQFNPGFYQQARMMFLVMALMFGPILYMAIVANEFTNFSKGTSYLLMPNSRFEKWLLSILSIASYFIIFSLLFRLIDIWMINRFIDGMGISSESIGVLEFDSDVYIISTLVGSTISMGIVLGSHYFKKNSLILSLIVMFCLLILIFFLDFIFANALIEGSIIFGDSSPFGPIYVTSLGENPIRYSLEFDMSPIQVICAIFLPVLAGLSLIYLVRIKEKQL